jgi:hypothetical protein
MVRNNWKKKEKKRKEKTANTHPGGRTEIV